MDLEDGMARLLARQAPDLAKPLLRVHGTAVGDWTKKIHAALAKPCARPAWIYGPFPSPFSTASGYDKLITIASGIGITPSISAVVHLGETRQVHLIWIGCAETPN